MKERLTLAGGRLLLIGLWGAAWEVAAASGALPRGLIGQPSEFLLDFFKLVVDDTLTAAALITLDASFVGFVLRATL